MLWCTSVIRALGGVGADRIPVETVHSRFSVRTYVKKQIFEVENDRGRHSVSTSDFRLYVYRAGECSCTHAYTPSHPAPPRPHLERRKISDLHTYISKCMHLCTSLHAPTRACTCTTAICYFIVRLLKTFRQGLTMYCILAWNLVQAGLRLWILLPQVLSAGITGS